MVRASYKKHSSRPAPSSLQGLGYHPAMAPNAAGRVKQEILRGSCDRCWAKKRRCPGGDPCSRCARGSFACTHSPRGKIGRPTKRAGAEGASQQQGGGKTAKQEEQEAKKQKKGDEKSRPSTAGGGEIAARSNVSCRSFGFRASSSTGLAGLPESQYLSCFLEHCAPM